MKYFQSGQKQIRRSNSEKFTLRANLITFRKSLQWSQKAQNFSRLQVFMDMAGTNFLEEKWNKSKL